MDHITSLLKTSRWDIKWVDDTHALGVFDSIESAAEALALRHPIIKVCLNY